MTIYDRIGQDQINQVISDFYDKAFNDPIIGYFFDGKDQSHLTKQQIDFTTGMLGGPKKFQGNSLEVAHKTFQIRNAHFNRRQVILKDVMQTNGLDSISMNEWLMLEENFRKLIVTVSKACKK